MSKDLKINLRIDAKTGELKKVSDGFVIFDKRVQSAKKNTTDFNTKLMNIAKAVGGIYLIKKAVDLVTDSFVSLLGTASEFEDHGNRMSAFTTSLAENRSEMARATKFAQDYKQNIAKTTETLLLMKNYGLKDTNEQLKIYANTAIGSEKSIKQFAEAVADALTGENERLKEFGVKASKMGDQIGYAWVDSSGKTRNVIIENNNQVIDSTLSAIFNEKYVGQIEKRANSWSGLMQGMENDWVLFKKNITDAGLLSYFKGLATNISVYMKAGFADSKAAAKSFAEGTISFLNSIIRGIGNVVKAINIVISSFSLAYAGYQKLAGAAMGGSVSDVKAEIAELERVKKEGDYGTFSNQNRGVVNAEISALKKKIETYKKWNVVRKEGDDATDENLKSIVKINNLVKDTTNALTNPKGMQESQSQIDKLLKDKKDAITKINNELKAGYGGLSESATKASPKASKAASKAAKSASKDIELVRRNMEETGLGFTDSFANSFDDMLHGDMINSFSNFFDSIGGTMMSGFITKMSDSLSKSLSSLLSGLGDFGGFLGGAAMTGIGMALNVFMEDEIATPPELPELLKVSDSMANALKNIEEAQNTTLDYTRSMTESLLLIAKSFGSIENNILRSDIDFSGSLYQETSKSGFLFGGSSTELYGNTLDIGQIALDGMMDSIMEEISKYTSTTWYGKTKTSYIYNETDVSSDINTELLKAFTESLAGATQTANLLGLDATSIERAVIDIPKFTITGKTAEAITAEIEQAFSAEMDAVYQDVFGAALTQYQLAGEGFAETAIRVATNMDQVTYSLEKIDLSLSNTANEVYELTEAMISGAGNIDLLNSGMSSYMDNFFSEQEQDEMQLDSMTKSFQAIGLVIPETNEEFRALAEGIDINTTSGAELFGGLMNLADGFALLTDEGMALSDVTEDSISELSNFKTNVMDTFRDLSAVTAEGMMNNMDYYINREDYSGATSAYNSFVDDARISSGTSEDFLSAVGTVANKIQTIQPDNPYKTMEDNQESMIVVLEDIKTENAALRSEMALMRKQNIEIAKRA